MDFPDAVMEEPGSRDGRSEEDGSFAMSALRTGKLPSNHHTKDNSDNGIKTLGLLGGTLGRDNKLQVTHLLLAKMTAAPWKGLRMCRRLSIWITLSSLSRNITLRSRPLLEGGQCQSRA